MSNDKPIPLYIKDGARVDKRDDRRCYIADGDICRFATFCHKKKYFLSNEILERTPECIEAERTARELVPITKEEIEEALRRGAADARKFNEGMS